jgi:LPXTG-motif cell wall-anchored protein
VEYHTLASGNYHVADVELEVTPPTPTAPTTAQTSPTEPTAADPGTPSEFGTAPSDVVPDVVPTMDDTLPQTASSLPLVLTIGILALVGAAALHRRQRRT